jgi:glucose-1-phosphate thymidylyltransferase
MRTIGVVPAAGFARRLQPLTCSKEMLVVHGRPVMDVLLDRLVAAPCDEIRVVTRPEKRDVAVHAAARGAVVVEAVPRCVTESVLAGIAGTEDSDLVAFGFPDTIWEPLDGFSRLRAGLDVDVDAVLGIFRSDEPARSDTVGVEGDRVVWIDVKASRPRSDLVWGCAVARVHVLRAGAEEPEPGHHLDTLARLGRVAAVRLVDPFVDIGTPERLAAFTAEA